ncbi:MAG: hypothetical protein ACTSRS_20525 [Candidatus Helarchaeota archaeon]
MSDYKAKCLMFFPPHIDVMTLFVDYVDFPFALKNMSILGCGFGSILVKLPYETVYLSIWTPTTSNRFQWIRPSFYKGAFGAVLLFDLTQYQSFNPFIFDIIQELYSNIDAIPLILVGVRPSEDSERQVPPEDVTTLLEQIPQCTYFEINRHDNQIPHIFHTVAELFIAQLNILEEDRRKANEFRKKRFQTFLTTLEELNFHVNDRNEVEILNEHGYFTIDIISGYVRFEPYICVTCSRSTCQFKKTPRTKSLCIVSKGAGWSNLSLSSHYLLTLSKIHAIAENCLPQHVLHQMQEILTCKKYKPPRC